MANSNFVVHNGLTVGPLTIDATTGTISTTGNISASGTGPQSFSGNIVAASGTSSTSTTTGALVVTGGAGISGNLYVSGNLSVAGNTMFVNTTTITTSDTIAAPTMNAGTFGNTGATFTGATYTVSSGIVPSSNAAINIGGTSSQYFNNIYAVNFLGTSTTAKYADLAERYCADADYEPGTVVDFGGSAEITLSTIDGSQFIAGVISTNPAYLMNDNDPSMLPVALMGRVPCKVTGPIQKGAMLVSNGDGTARMERYPIIGSVLGKALESHGDGIGVIEVVVGRL